MSKKENANLYVKVNLTLTKSIRVDNEVISKEQAAYELSDILHLSVHGLTSNGKFVEFSVCDDEFEIDWESLVVDLNE